MSPAFVVLNYALDASAHFGMVSGIDKCESTPVARQLDACEQTKGVGIIQGLSHSQPNTC